jgi:hypothetical protein
MRRICWTSACEDFADGWWRRRALTPASGLGGFGWDVVLGKHNLERGDCIFDAVVLDAADPEFAALVGRFKGAGVPTVVDASRSWGVRSRHFLGQAEGVDAVVVPSTAAGAWIGRLDGARIEVVSDPAETPTSVGLAAMTAGVTYVPGVLQSQEGDLAIWLCGPEDDAARELDEVARLWPELSAGGARLLAVVPVQILPKAKVQLAGAELSTWSLERQFAELSRARVALVPWQAGESVARRTAMAGSVGAPTLIVGEEAAAPHSDAARVLHLLDWDDAPAVLPSAGSGAVDTALAWRGVLERAIGGAPTRAPSRPRRLIVFADLMQDADFCQPIVREALRDERLLVDVVVTRWLADQSPSATAVFRELGVEPQLVEREAVVAGKAPDLTRCDALLTPVATNLNAHRRAHVLVERARARGIPTFSLQHGLENVGLTYFDESNPETVLISTDHIFTWAPPDFEPAGPAELKRKFVHVGIAKAGAASLGRAPLPSGRGPVVAVFENLHWHRYSEAFRERFTADLIAAATSLASRLFVLKPHHGGRWASRAGLSGLPSNVLLIDPKDPRWERFTAPAIIADAEAVITTPSTVALDAALAGRPVAVAGYDLDLPLYEPMPVLRRTEDWMAFLEMRRSDSAEAGRLFLRRTVVSGDAAGDAVGALVDLISAGG